MPGSKLGDKSSVFSAFQHFIVLSDVSCSECYERSIYDIIEEILERTCTLCGCSKPGSK